jgi:response regulator RpfG family c-di-GMP phosphodiesterase
MSPRLYESYPRGKTFRAFSAVFSAHRLNVLPVYGFGGRHPVGDKDRRIAEKRALICLESIKIEGGVMSAKEDLLKNKKILIVDDEPDVVSTLVELLSMCDVVRAITFEEAKRQLESEPLDVAVLDIMGVNGYELLKIAVAKKITAVMLTAHAFSPEDTVKSFKGGAAYYVPKEKMFEIPEILADVLMAKEKGQSTLKTWLEWADSYYGAEFGSAWLEAKKELEEKSQ